MCIIKFFEREVLCFEELSFKKFIVPIVQHISFKTFILPILQKRGLQKRRLKICSVGNMRKARVVDDRKGSINWRRVYAVNILTHDAKNINKWLISFSKR